MKKALIALSIAAASLFAANNSGYQIGIGVGRNSVSNSPINGYNFLNLRVGKYLPKNHILRFELERSEKLSGDIVGGNRLTRALLNVEHYFDLSNSKLKPYCFIGGGYQWVKGVYKNSGVADLGVGIQYPIVKKLSFFAEIRGLRDFYNNDNHLGGIAGIVYRFGEKTPVVPVKVQKPKPPKDSDHDGVPDNLDKCPNTPAGVKVDKNGCPIDSDHDGVPDYLDKCPNTPQGVKVDKNGCPIDSDHDGVPNYLDKCPNTPQGVKVNKNGCPVMFNFDINFDTNSAKIKPEYMKRIKEFAQFLKENPKAKAIIEGYTDNRGNPKYNLILSQKRAKAVYEVLIKLGINKSRLTWVGFGEKNPIAPNTTPQGRAKNRRVVAKIVY